MVELAQRNTPAARFIVGSLYDANFPDGCVGVAATGEAVNYATDGRAGVEALSRLAGQVHEALAPGGWWIMDISGPGRGEANRTTKQFHRRDDWCLGMTAIESGDGARLDREITIFVADEQTQPADDRHYRRIEEHHTLRLFRREEIKQVLVGIGFEVNLLTDYRSPAVQLDLPGWYVVQAQKPVR